MGLWIGNRGESNMIVRQGKVVKKQGYRVSIAHQLYRSLMESYGFAPRPRKMMTRKQKNMLNGDDEDEEKVEFDDMVLEEEGSENDGIEEDT